MEPTGAPLLELRNAVVVRDGREILRVDSLQIEAGEHVAVLGPNGAGKSTLIRLLTRDIRPLAHDDCTPAVTMLGRERWDLLEARRIMGVVSDALQDTYAIGVSVRDCVTSGFFGSVGPYHHQDVTAAMREKADERLAFLEIEHLAGRRMDTLSTGEARRALIARALVRDPMVLVLDEPCAGLDPHATWHFHRTMQRIAAAGHSLLLVTHHIEDIVPEVTRVVMLKDGSVFRDGQKGELITGDALGSLFDIPAQVEEREGWYRLW
ncbi:MAG: ATP-binding cassette domain-containing protein [Coriobacteriia bacterium]|nr:ATP-binding cassette domain-containing protein [Coriobacteriia bacterium]